MVKYVGVMWSEKFGIRLFQRPTLKEDLAIETMLDRCERYGYEQIEYLDKRKVKLLKDDYFVFFEVLPLQRGYHYLSLKADVLQEELQLLADTNSASIAQETAQRDFQKCAQEDPWRSHYFQEVICEYGYVPKKFLWQIVPTDTFVGVQEIAEYADPNFGYTYYQDNLVFD